MAEVLPEEKTPESALSEAAQARVLARIVKETGLTPMHVRRTVELLTGGATIPFIARYRKELTGNMDEVVVATVEDRHEALVALEQRRAFVLTTIQSQGKLTPELRAAIDRAEESRELEDLYLPFKPKRKTRAQKARDAGLEPLADMLLAGDDAFAAKLDALIHSDYPDKEAVLAGARDIIAERVSEHREVRETAREAFDKQGYAAIKAGKAEDPEGKFKSLLGLDAHAATLPGHRILAMNRGEREGVLSVSVQAPPDRTLALARRSFIKKTGTASAKQIEQAIDDGYARLIAPSMEAELRARVSETAEDEAIEVFAKNLRELLLAPPLGEHAVIGIDPGFRTGCKVALVDPTGDLVTHTAIYPHAPQNQAKAAAEVLVLMIAQFGKEFPIEFCAYGNGTASRETGKFLGDLKAALGRQKKRLEVVMVNESGASVYSASEAAREEFPDLDLTVRGAISIARRLQDPLAELIKIDPKAIGVGQYQHDVDQKKLARALGRVVESCVNSVGVDLNTASAALLGYVSGLTPKLAKAIVAHRHKEGRFENRKQLNEVKGLGPKAFELCAGFLRIRGGQNILDNTAVHPERYTLVGRICEKAGLKLVELVAKPDVLKKLNPKDFVNEAEGAGLPTITDIFAELAKPGRDPRGTFEVFEYAKGVESMADLTPGMVIPGVVTNVTKFGCFVDVGVHQDGLVHVSELANKFVNDPAEVVAVGQKVRVKVLTVEADRHRIGLSIKQAGA